jgi:hypothetical protein
MTSSLAELGKNVEPQELDCALTKKKKELVLDDPNPAIKSVVFGGAF